MTKTRVNAATHIPKSTLVKKIDTNLVKRELIEQLERQKKAIEWNTEYVGKKRKNGQDIIEALKPLQLTNNSMIVQLYFEDCLTPSKIRFNSEGKIISWAYEPTRIDMRKHQTSNNPDDWKESPVPTIFKGVIVALAPDVQLNALRKRKELEDFGMDVSNYIIPSVGDVVYLRHFQTVNTRFYIDKNERLLDYLIDPSNYSLDHFDFIFHITDYEIESLVRKEDVPNLADAKYPHEELFSKINASNIDEYLVINP